ncbi:MAG TPA: alpha/beta fold hydrolase [Acidimicrobiales bacterium]|nr:alpha/beta fold hydrolase [Acidimicrobiales bacterium]
MTGSGSFPPGISGTVEGSGDRLPLLWGHGLTSSREDEDRAGLFRWSAAGRRVIRWDAPGHGRSAPARGPEILEWRELGRTMLSVADANGVGRFVAGGTSMGTATSLWAAVAAPERVAAMLLVVPPTGWDSRPAQAAIYREDAELLDREGVTALADRSEELPLPPVFAPVEGQVRAARRASLLAADARNLATVFRGAAASDLPAPEEIAGLAMPTLILAWAGDPGHPVSTAERLAQLLPQARLEVGGDLKSILGWSQVGSEWLEGLAE